MVAMLAFGGTYAYFTDTAAAGAGSFSTGKLTLTAGTQVSVEDAVLMPGDSIEKAGSLTVDATEGGAFVGIVFTKPAELGEHLTVEFEGVDGTWTYDETSKIYVYTGSGANPVAVEADVDFTVTVALAWDADNTYQEIPAAEFSLAAKAVQAKNFATNEGNANLATVAAALVAALPVA